MEQDRAPAPFLRQCELAGETVTSLVTIVILIAATRTKTGLRVRSEIVKGRHPMGVTVPPRELANMQLRKHDVHGDWNYTISPAQRK